jgi:alanine racemase
MRRSSVPWTRSAGLLMVVVGSVTEMRVRSVPSVSKRAALQYALAAAAHLLSIGGMPSPPDNESASPITRRSFVAAAAVAAVAGRGVARTEEEVGDGRIVPGSAPNAGFDPWIEVDRAALTENTRAVSRLAGGRPIVAVVKNNAYGLGLETAGPVLALLPEVSLLAVVRADEALALRKAGVRKPILLMGPATEDELLELVPLDIVQAPYRDVAPTLLARVAQRTGGPVRVHLYVDTGMHRMGMPIDQALDWAESLGRAPGLRIEGAFTELTEDADFDRQQALRLRGLQTAAKARGLTVPLLHAASSDAVMHQTTETFLDAVRPGLALYGGYVSERAMQLGGVRPAYRLKAKVIRVDHLAAGEGVSYHRRYVAERPVWTATLAVGHVDGYPTGAVNGCEVFANGRLYPVMGTVSASHTLISLGDDQMLKVGDEVTLVGPDHPAIHPNEVAKRAKWSEYNMFMHLSPRLARRVV